MKALASPERSLDAPSHMRLVSDDRLARRAVQGDQRAFEAIYRRYHQELYRFCLAMVGNPQDAQDALQNTMVKVLRALPGEERQIKLKPWLYRIARNESVEALRRRRDSTELEPDETQASGEIAQTAEDRERLRVLLADMEQLPDRQRSALVMRELAGLDFAQIGEAFGSSPGVARQTLYEARLSLRQMEEGREMSCEAVMRALSDADGRVTRRRNVHAHLRSCASCRAFRDGIAKRQGEFAAIAPLPVALSAGLLQSLLAGHGSAASAAGAAGGAAAAGSSGVAGTIGAGAGKAVATSAIVKATATVAVVAVAGVSVADRTGVVDLGLPGGRDAATKSSSKVPGESTSSGGQASGDESGGAAERASKTGQGQKNGKADKSAASKGPGHAKGKSAHGKHARSAAGKSSGKRSNGNPSRGRSQAARERSGPPAAGRGQGGGGGSSARADHSPSGGGEPAPRSSPPAAAARPPRSEARPSPPPSKSNSDAGGTTSEEPSTESLESSEP